MTNTISNKTDVSDIKLNEVENKHVLDTPNKIIRWIKHKFEEQECIDFRRKPHNRFIDLSDCIISSISPDGKAHLTNLCDITLENQKNALLDCFIYNGYGSDYDNSYYQEVKERIVCRNSLIYAAFFHHVKFHKEVDFEGTKFRGHASFIGCLFEKDANFQKTIYTGNFDFSKCIFDDYVWFNKAKFDLHQVNFEHSIFKAGLKANKIEFVNDHLRKDKPDYLPYINFNGTEFYNKLDLSNIDFTRSCLFSGAKLDSSVEFCNTNFRTVLDLSNSLIDGNILFAINTDEKQQVEVISRNIINKISFNHINITGRIDIECCEINEIEGFFASIREGAIMRIYKSFVKTVDFTSISNNGVLTLVDNENKIDRFILTSAINFGIIETENTEITNINDRRTARILKDSALKYGNSIDALEFRKEEMRLLKKERKDKSLGFDFLLWLNGFSNNHGTEWKKGIRFTFFSWICFYLFF